MLSCDIGGTNTTLGIVEWKKKPIVVFKKKYSTQSIKNISKLVDEFLLSVDDDLIPSQGCFGVAGPITQTKNGTVVTMTNSNLCVREKDLLKTGLRRVSIVNDFVTLGYGVDVLESNQQKVLQKGVTRGTRAVIGVGTGLGMAIVSDRGVLASEGGHMELPPRPGEEGFAKFLRKKMNVNSNEPIEAEYALCGDGVERIYEYLSGEKTSAGNILSGKKAKMREAQQYFLVLLARVCRNLSLCAHSVGGLYIGGGVVLKNTHLFDDNFAKMVTKGNDFGLSKMKISVITSEDTSLLGGAMILKERGRT